MLRIRNKFVDDLPTGKVEVWQFIACVKSFITELDIYIDSIHKPTPTQPNSVQPQPIDKGSDDFRWNDELVKELLWSRFPFPEGVTEVQPILDEFKMPKSFPKEAVIDKGSDVKSNKEQNDKPEIL